MDSFSNHHQHHHDVYRLVIVEVVVKVEEDGIEIFKEIGDITTTIITMDKRIGLKAS